MPNEISKHCGGFLFFVFFFDRPAGGLRRLLKKCLGSLKRRERETKKKFKEIPVNDNDGSAARWERRRVQPGNERGGRKRARTGSCVLRRANKTVCTL